MILKNKRKEINKYLVTEMLNDRGRGVGAHDSLMRFEIRPDDEREGKKMIASMMMMLRLR